MENQKQCLILFFITFFQFKPLHMSVNWGFVCFCGTVSTNLSTSLQETLTNYQFHSHLCTQTHNYTCSEQTKLPMRMLTFSHFNQQMYSEGSHRSSTSKASTHTNTHIRIHKYGCVLTHNPTALPTHWQSWLQQAVTQWEWVMGRWLCIFSCCDSREPRLHSKKKRSFHQTSLYYKIT